MSSNSPFGNPNQGSNNLESGNTPSPYGTPPAYSNAPAYSNPDTVQPTGRNSTMSILGLVAAFFIPLLGLILSIIAFKQAAETGDNRGLAKAGIIISAIFLVLSVILSIAMFGFAGAVSSTETSF